MSIRKRLSKFFAYCFSLLTCVAAGCSGQSDALTPVSGKVKYKDVVLNRGAIVFTPDADHGNRGAIATGAIQQDGTYQLKTGDKVGAKPGWYRVTLAAYSDKKTPIPGHDFSIPVSLLPNRYRDPDASELVREVKAQTENVIHFELD